MSLSLLAGLVTAMAVGTLVCLVALHAADVLGATAERQFVDDWERREMGGGKR